MHEENLKDTKKMTNTNIKQQQPQRYSTDYSNNTITVTMFNRSTNQ